MNKQTITFSVQEIDNTVTRIGRSYITHPEIKFSGGHIKWYEDKLKQKHSDKKRMNGYGKGSNPVYPICFT